MPSRLQNWIARTHLSKATFVPAIGPRATSTVPITIEVTPPRILNTQPYGVGQTSLDHFDLTFTESIDVAALAGGVR